MFDYNILKVYDYNILKVYDYNILKVYDYNILKVFDYNTLKLFYYNLFYEDERAADCNQGWKVNNKYSQKESKII